MSHRAHRPLWHVECFVGHGEMSTVDDSERICGTVIGDRYEVVEKLASGAFGHVYRARQRILDRDIALKVLRPEWQREKRVIERFRAEAAAAASVAHAHVVEVFDFGETGKLLFMAMELLRGCSLRDRLESGLRPTESKAIELCSELLAGLGAAHQAGVVHGDVKPSNIILHRGPEDEVVKLIDFGAASPVSAPPLDAEDVIGTPSYMAPDLLNGRASASTDLYAVGAVLYEMIFGAPPFAGDSVSEVLKKQVQAPLSRPASGHCSEEIWRVVKRALAKTAGQRFASAEEMRCALHKASRPTVTESSSPDALLSDLRAAIGVAICDGDLDRVTSLYLDLADLLAALDRPWTALSELEEAASVITGGEGLASDAGPAKAWAVAVRMAEIERAVGSPRALVHARAGLRRALLAQDRAGATRARCLVDSLVGWAGQLLPGELRIEPRVVSRRRDATTVPLRVAHG
jgi:serine/threonine protein kinase